MKISKSKRFFTLLIATTFILFGLLVLWNPVLTYADNDTYITFLFKIKSNNDQPGLTNFYVDGSLYFSYSVPSVVVNTTYSVSIPFPSSGFHTLEVKTSNNYSYGLNISNLNFWHGTSEIALFPLYDGNYTCWGTYNKNNGSSILYVAVDAPSNYYYFSFAFNGSYSSGGYTFSYLQFRRYNDSGNSNLSLNLNVYNINIIYRFALEGGLIYSADFYANAQSKLACLVASGWTYTTSNSNPYIYSAVNNNFVVTGASSTRQVESYFSYFRVGFNPADVTPTPTPTNTPTPTPAPTPTPDPAEWLNNYIFNQTSEDMWVGVEDINADDVTYDVIPAWSYKNFYFRRNTTYRITARTEQENVYYSLQYYTDLYNYVPLEYSLSSEGWYSYTELPYTSINISTGSDTNTSGIYTFVRFRHDLPTLPPVTPVPGTSFTPDPSSSPTEVPYVTPIPSNPTLIPDNSTPTPIPDISGEAVAGFNKLTNIFNGLFDAAYQTVNAANGNFWTSFFFIGLPIFLVILGLIAWIIFGSSDDD